MIHLPSILAQTPPTFWMPPGASTHAEGVDFLFYFIMSVTIFFTLLIGGVMLWFIWKYRRRPGHAAQPAPRHSTALEVTWTVIPLMIVMTIFFFGFRTFLDMAIPPANAEEVMVTAFKWGWNFTYDNGAQSPDLYVPRDRPVRLVLESRDVIHSLFIPAFRIKKDCVPGRFNIAWFEATKEGEFPIYCAEYCGTRHSMMLSRVVVLDAAQYAAWKQEAANWVKTLPPVEAGARLYQARGCQACHSIDGSPAIGPTLKDLFGAERIMRDGARLIADENYLRESILVPGARVVAGYDNVMPSFQGRLNDLEITALIAWMKSISKHHTAAEPVGSADEPGESSATP